MAKADKTQLSRLEEGLMMAMRAIDEQVAREMQRSDAEREQKGVQKWDPLQKRIEKAASILLNAFAKDDIKLDSLLVLSQALTKSLQLIVDEIGTEGLGHIRSGYCNWTLENISTYADRAIKQLKGNANLM